MRLRWILVSVLVSILVFYALWQITSGSLSSESIALKLGQHKFPELAGFTLRETELAELGYQIFRDPLYSKDRRVACATCHNPHISYADNRQFSEGHDLVRFNTPTLINAFARKWFFWNGRADSLEMQARDPLEAMAEHQFSRLQVASLTYHRYMDSYRILFGEFPEAFIELFQDQAWIDLPASPKRAELVAPTELQADWQEYLASVQPSPSSWDANHQRLNPAQRSAVDEVFANTLRALAQFQKGLVARDSAFDRFVNRVEMLGLEAALTDDFGQEELRGFVLFTGKAACVRCHSGPFFTDEDFHNTGLARAKRNSLGREEGLLRWLDDPWRCRFENNAWPAAEACGSSAPLRVSLAPLLKSKRGSQKTPTLRNVALTAPYLHDGSYSDLTSLLNGYNEAKNFGIGKVDERIQPLGLSVKELSELEAFLRSLSSEIEDFTTSFAPDY